MKVVYVLFVFLFWAALIAIGGWGLFYISNGIDTISAYDHLLSLTSSQGDIQSKSSEFIYGACSQQGILKCFHLYWYVNSIMYAFLAGILIIALSLLSKLFSNNVQNDLTKEEGVCALQLVQQKLLIDAKLLISDEKTDWLWDHKVSKDLISDIEKMNLNESDLSVSNQVIMSFSERYNSIYRQRLLNVGLILCLGGIVTIYFGNIVLGGIVGLVAYFALNYFKGGKI